MSLPRPRTLLATTKRRWPEWLILFSFFLLASGSIVAPLLVPALASADYVPAFNAALSIGTSGIVAFVFYYTVNERLERTKRRLVTQGALRSYRNAKRNIAVAIIHASHKGGREELVADSETIEKILTVEGFRELFEGGREANEGYYAFQNQMSDHTYEFDEIIFNLKSMSRAFERLTDATEFLDNFSYNLFIELDVLIRRIEHNGAGYDESKLLCSFIWEMFSGWHMIEGYIGYDRIERSIETHG